MSWHKIRNDLKYTAMRLAWEVYYSFKSLSKKSLIIFFLRFLILKVAPKPSLPQDRIATINHSTSNFYIYFVESANRFGVFTEFLIILAVVYRKDQQGGTGRDFP